ncbi:MULTISPECIES: ABC transporter substrate-binding protein [Micromonospora]|uniref:ABC transporter substrate-binding protein n=1 Tax=Micromonospora TaxID=1873 RepID=UPI0018F14EC2|nr:ABC transporter substrate-binding protein [Micromonospora haikouensis]
MAAVAIAAMVATTAACSSGDDAASGKTKIRFTYATGDETWNGAVKAVSDAFNAKSTTAVVQLDPLPAGTDYATALKTLDSTGRWPAIIEMRDTKTYVEAGKLAPLPSEVTDLLDDKAVAKSEDGNVYITPSGALNGEIGLNIVYDKDYFAQHNLKVPTTYTEFIDLLKAIKANGDTPLATAAGDIWPSDQLWKPLAAPYFAKWSDKGGFWNAVQDGTASLEDLREPLTRLQDITNNYVLKGWQSTADAQTSTLLVNHQAVMATSSAGIGRLNDIHKVDPKFKAGLFIIPDDAGNIDVLKNAVNGDTAPGLAISSQAKQNGAEYDAAVDFLTFFYSVEGANIVEKAGVVAPNIKLADQITRNTAIPGAEDYFALLKNPKLVWYQNDPKATTFSGFNTFFRQTRIEMQTGQITLDEAVAKSQTEFNKLVKN